MSKQIYHWNLVDVSNDSSIMRYCHNCGKIAIFKDSKQRRRNANGKTIFEYAIYKCENDHTWNKPIGKYPSLMYIKHSEISENVHQEDSFETINMPKLRNEGVKEVEIVLGEVIGRWRLDKLLRDLIQGISRNKVGELIRFQKILLNGKVTKQDALLKSGQRIMIFID